ncbi:MAG: phosphate ABC transporter substrate-binding protein [Halomonas sp.]|nr:phosphate ABC transporter substrate-binding protein [Halomonas sp.]MBR2515136.1 phosphate ABC transporter substrate-binding protein [Halomonas sp.]
MLKRLNMLGASVLLSVIGHAATADVLLVASVEAPFTRLASSELTDIYLGRRTQIGKGLAVIPLDQSGNSIEREEFYTRYIGQTPAQIKAHWSRLIFTGRGQPPQTLSDSRAVIDRLVSDNTTLGYINAAYFDDRLRVVQVE